MGISRKNRGNLIKKMTNATNKALPVVDKGLRSVGSTAKSVAKVSVPVIEKGVSAVYDTMATGLDLGMKGVKTVTKGGSRRRRSHRRSRGGRRSRRHSRRH